MLGTGWSEALCALQFGDEYRQLGIYAKGYT